MNPEMRSVYYLLHLLKQFRLWQLVCRLHFPQFDAIFVGTNFTDIKKSSMKTASQLNTSNINNICKLPNQGYKICSYPLQSLFQKSVV